jgi:hypothetical protein
MTNHDSFREFSTGILLVLHDDFGCYGNDIKKTM